MIRSKDLALIIVFSVLTIVFMLLIGQVPELVTGIPGISYVFTIVYSINQTVALLMFEGRRWRFFARGLLVTLLGFSFILTWNRPLGMATIVNAFIVDVVFNSVYGFFEQRNKLLWWAILSEVYHWSTHSLWIILFGSLFFYSFELIMETWFIPIMSMMLPIIIIEAIVGGYLGYQFYRRVKKVQN